MEVAVCREGKDIVVLREVSSLEVASLVASYYGFYDVDVEPMGPGKVSVTAYGENRTVTVNGTTVYDVCERLIDLIVGDKT